MKKNNNGNLWVNGQLVSSWSEDSGMLTGIDGEEEALSLKLPDHVLIDKKNVETHIIEVDSEEASKMAELLRIDEDKYVGKKIKIFISIIGNLKPGGR